MATWVYRGGKFIYKHRKKIARTITKAKLVRKAQSLRKKMRGTKTKSSGTPSMRGGNGTVAKRRKSIRARSAQPVKKTTFYRKGGCPPGYRYDYRRRLCEKI